MKGCADTYTGFTNQVCIKFDSNGASTTLILYILVQYGTVLQYVLQYTMGCSILYR